MKKIALSLTVFFSFSPAFADQSPLSANASLPACSAKADLALNSIGYKVGPLYGAYEGEVLTVLNKSDISSGPIGSVSIEAGECKIELDNFSALETCSAMANEALNGIGYKVGPPYGAYEGKVLTVLDKNNLADGPVGSIRIDGSECEIDLDL